jgi:hypothetical protein
VQRHDRADKRTGQDLKSPYTVGWEFIFAANRLVEYLDLEGVPADFDRDAAAGKNTSRHIALALEIIRTGVAQAVDGEEFAESHADAVRAGMALLTDKRFLFEM